MTALVSGAGAQVALGPCLGRGGEGSVYAVRDHPQLAAKIYHRPPPEGQARKLMAMCRVRGPALLSLCAWPLDVLRAPAHREGEPPVVGLLMPRLDGLRPIHLLYSPRDRRREFPQITWAELAQTAAALARAFEALHRRGHCVGDVNPNNVLVGFGEQGVKLRLIDTDSFQIAEGDQLWPCRVGAPEFLPPELSGRPLDGLQRTPDTDAFGLAVLIFHLLFLGRHPYAGTPLGEEPAPSIPEAILQHRFAYGAGARALGVERPPHSPPLSVLPTALAGLFERAFASSTAGQRPTPKAWAEALERLATGGLRRCGRDEAHVYPREAWGCPWCTLQDQLGHDLFTPQATRAPFDPESIRRQLLALPDLPSPPVVMEASVPRASATLWPAWGPVIAGIALGGAGAAQGVWWVGGVGAGLVAGGVGWRQWLVSRRQARMRALMRAWRALQTQQGEVIRQWTSLVSQWTRDRQALLAALDQGLEAPPPDMSTLRAEVEQARAQALELHLSGFRLDQARLPALNQRRLKRLRHAGVETAADLNRDVLASVGNIGEKLIGRLLSWREAHERTLRFDEEATLRALTERAAALAQSRQEGRLRDGPHHLARLREEAERQLSVLRARWEALEERRLAMGQPC